MVDDSGVSASVTLAREALSYELIAAKDQFNTGHSLSAQEDLEGLLSQALNRASNELEKPSGIRNQEEPLPWPEGVDRSSPYASPFKDGYTSLHTKGDRRSSPSPTSSSHSIETIKTRFPHTYTDDEDFLVPTDDTHDSGPGNDKDNDYDYGSGNHSKASASPRFRHDGSPQLIQESYQQSLVAAGNVAAEGLVMKDPMKKEMKTRIAASQASTTSGNDKNKTGTEVSHNQAVFGALSTIIAIIEAQSKHQKWQEVHKSKSLTEETRTRIWVRRHFAAAIQQGKRVQRVRHPMLYHLWRNSKRRRSFWRSFWCYDSR